MMAMVLEWGTKYLHPNEALCSSVTQAAGTELSICVPLLPPQEVKLHHLGIIIELKKKGNKILGIIKVENFSGIYGNTLLIYT